MKDEALLGASEHAAWRLDTVFLVEKISRDDMTEIGIQYRFLWSYAKEKPVIRNDLIRTIS